MERTPLTKESAVKILNSRKLLTEPGKYQATVTGVTPYDRDGTSTMIVNLSAMTDWQLGKAKQAIKDQDWDKACNTALTSSQRVGKDFIPKKGEIVNINLDFVNTANAENALLVTSLTEVPLSKGSVVNISFEEEEEELATESAAAGKV